MTLAYMLVGNIASQKKKNNKRAGWFSLKKEFFP